MTVREAFEKAGYPVPEGALIFSVGNSNFSDGWMVANSRNPLAFKEIRFAGHPIFGWGAGWLSRDGALTPVIDLSNLPAIDAYDALPDVIKKVVKP